MALQVQAAILSAASSPPPTTLLHSWSYFHPLTPPPPPLPLSKPLSPGARQCCMTGQTQPLTSHPHVSPPLLPWLASSSDGSVTGETKEQLHKHGGVNDLTRLLVRHPAVQPPWNYISLS